MCLDNEIDEGGVGVSPAAFAVEFCSGSGLLKTNLYQGLTRPFGFLGLRVSGSLQERHEGGGTDGDPYFLITDGNVRIQGQQVRSDISLGVLVPVPSEVICPLKQPPLIVGISEATGER